MPFGIKFPDEEVIRKSRKKQAVLPLMVSTLDLLVARRGLERGSTLLVTGGCGTGKSTFVVQSLYGGLCAGEKAVYLSFEENLEKLKRHMKDNFGWDLEKFEKDNSLFLYKMDPFKVARSVEAFLAQEKGDLLVRVDEIEFPFIPDRIAVDSLSALKVAFMGNAENYRYYIKHLFELLERYNSLNFIISETEADPGVYRSSGIEEFLADSVIVMYNSSSGIGKQRERALEILKMRFSEHVKRAVPFRIGRKGIELVKHNS